MLKQHKWQPSSCVLLGSLLSIISNSLMSSMSGMFDKLRAIDSAPAAENQSRLRFPGVNYQSSAWDVKYQGFFVFFFPPWKTFMRFVVFKVTCWGGWSVESECQMDPWDNLLNSFGLQIFWCWWETFLELSGCLTLYSSLAKVMKNSMIWTDGDISNLQ